MASKRNHKRDSGVSVAAGTFNYVGGPTASGTYTVNNGISSVPWSNGEFSLVSGASDSVAADNSSVEAAIYSHITALRALGKTAITSGEISRALGLPRSLVESTLPALTARGVKVI